MDNTTFIVESNSGDTITVVSGDMTSVASTGDSYGMLYRFENVEVLGKARLFSYGDLLVESGDLLSADETTFVLPDDASLEVGILELSGVTTLEGTPVSEQLLCSGCEAAP